MSEHTQKDNDKAHLFVGNMIVYPRAYDKSDADPRNHFMTGVNPEGQEVKVYIRVDGDYLASKEKDRVEPSIALFSKRRDNRAVTASPDNGPQAEKREGILLCSKMYKIEGTENEYEAGWAALLANDFESPEPLVGLGRVEILAGNPRFYKGEMAEIHQSLVELHKARAEVDDTDEIDVQILELQTALDDLLREENMFRFRAMFYKPEEIKDVEVSREAITEALAECIEKYTQDGKYGGAVIRVKDKKGEVSAKLSETVVSSFVFTESRPSTAQEASERYFKYGAGKWLLANKDKVKVDIIPVQYVNAAVKSFYQTQASQPHRLQALRNTYFDHKYQQPAVCRLALRPAQTTDGKSQVIGSVYAMTAPVGSPLELDRKGEFTVRIKGRDYGKKRERVEEMGGPSM